MSLSLPHNDFDYQHAVVIGGSIAALLAARVLSDHFREVTIIERKQAASSSGRS
jgi:glycine/D-amino acid oxidase-like deaminating enzyme